MSNGAAAAPNHPDELVFLALGGVGEIGMNLSLYGYAGRWLMIDCGITFADETLPGIDVIMPDPTFIAERIDSLDGLVVTHAHEDHIGAIPYLWQRLRCPVYATPFTAAVLRQKLIEAELEHEVPITEVPMSGSFRVGPFELELLTLTHSIPEPNAVVLRTTLGTVLHTGDWKFDPEPLVGAVADETRLRQLGDEGVLAMICDRTNALRPGEAGSEADVRKLTDRPCRPVPEARRRRLLCLECGAARIRDGRRRSPMTGMRRWSAARSGASSTPRARPAISMDIPPFLTDEEAAYLPRDKVLLICTGSQGEPRSALARIAEDDHPEIVLEAGDTVIFSSRVIPGNERAIGRLQNRLAALGVEIITEHDHLVHVSGHPAQDELHAHVRDGAAAHRGAGPWRDAPSAWRRRGSPSNAACRRPWSPATARW